MKLSEWTPIQQASWVDKAAEKFLDKKIVKQVSSAGMDWDEYLKELSTNAPFKAKNVNSFVVLENGYAVGFNENPAKGWSFPVVKYKGIYKGIIDIELKKIQPENWKEMALPEKIKFVQNQSTGVCNCTPSIGEVCERCAPLFEGGMESLKAEKEANN